MPPELVIEKLTRVWSEKREREIAVRVEYSIEDGDCRLIHLMRIEELD